MKTTGAGIMLLHNNNVILFKNKRSGKYSEGGGLIDPGESITQTASRELREESLNTFLIRNPSKSFSIKTGPYVCFCITLDGRINKNHYYNNKNKIVSNAPHYWKETTEMTMVPIRNMVEMTEKKLKTVTDTNNKTITVSDRTRRCFRHIYPKLVKKSINNPLKINKRKYKGNGFLHGTITYVS